MWVTCAPLELIYLNNEHGLEADLRLYQEIDNCGWKRFEANDLSSCTRYP